MQLSPEATTYSSELFEARQTALLKERNTRRSVVRQNLVDFEVAAQRAGYPGVLQPEIDCAVAVSVAKKEALCKAYEWDGKELTEDAIRGIEAEATAVLEQSLEGLVNGEQGRMGLLAMRVGGTNPIDSARLGELSRHVQRTICNARKAIHNDLTLRLLESKRASSKRSPSMKVKELSSRIEKFRTALVEHGDLWKQSLDRTLPDYPIANGDTLRKQIDGLARQLGALRPYIDRFNFPSVMGMAGVEWDVYDSAVSNDVAIRKGHSVEGVLQQLQQILGRLDSMSPDAEFELHTASTQAGPQHVTIHQHGAQARVNLNSTDYSHNVLTMKEQNVFSQVRAALQQGVPDQNELKTILARLDDFESSVHHPSALEKFQTFVNNSASYMTLLAPFIPALSAMLGK